MLPLLSLPEGEGRVGKSRFLLLVHFYSFLVCLWCSRFCLTVTELKQTLYRDHNMWLHVCLLLSFFFQDFRGFAVFAIRSLRDDASGMPWPFNPFHVLNQWNESFVSSHTVTVLCIFQFMFLWCLLRCCGSLWFFMTQLFVIIVLSHPVFMSLICSLFSGGWVSDRWTWMVRRRD